MTHIIHFNQLKLMASWRWPWWPSNPVTYFRCKLGQVRLMTQGDIIACLPVLLQCFKPVFVLGGTGGDVDWLQVPLLMMFTSSTPITSWPCWVIDSLALLVWLLSHQKCLFELLIDGRFCCLKLLTLQLLPIRMIIFLSLVCLSCLCSIMPPLLCNLFACISVINIICLSIATHMYLYN